MSASRIVLEAPEFGAGRRGQKRPLDMAVLVNCDNADYSESNSSSKEFASQLRQSMAQLSVQKGAERKKTAQQICEVAERAGANEIANIARKIAAEPNVARHLAKFTKEVVLVCDFVASINRS